MPKSNSQSSKCSSDVPGCSKKFQEEVVIVKSKDASVNQKSVVSPAKYWRFTLNNWTEAEFCSIVPIIEEFAEWAIIGQEIGDEGTPHLQGALCFKSKARFVSRISIKRDGVECIRAFVNKANGRSAGEIKADNIKYCSKEKVLYNKNCIIQKEVMTIKREDFYEYQEELVKLLEVPCEWDDRTIYWRYGDVNIGKTQFAKWLCVHLGAYVIGGTHKHMLAQVQNSDAPIYIVLLAYGDEKVSYRAIEQIKDGLFSSAFGCDNNKMSIRNAPHILIIGNEEPDYEDRNYHPTKYNVAKVDVD